MVKTSHKLFGSEMEYRGFLDKLIQERFETRAAFCQKVGVSESAASYFLAAGKKTERN